MCFDWPFKENQLCELIYDNVSLLRVAPTPQLYYSFRWREKLLFGYFQVFWVLLSETPHKLHHYICLIFSLSCLRPHHTADTGPYLIIGPAYNSI